MSRSGVVFVGVSEVDCDDPRILKQKVMLISNEDDPVMVGHITGFHQMPSGQHIPNVRLENGEDVFTFSMILPYHEGFKQFLDKLDYKERYALFRRMFELKTETTRLFYTWGCKE
jgi:hypothetical protein